MTGIEKTLAAAGAFIALLVSVFIKGRAGGKREVEQQYDQAIAKQRHDAAQKAKEVRDDVKQKTDDSVSEQLKSKWVRK